MKTKRSCRLQDRLGLEFVDKNLAWRRVIGRVKWTCYGCIVFLMFDRSYVLSIVCSRGFSIGWTINNCLVHVLVHVSLLRAGLHDVRTVEWQWYSNGNELLNRQLT